MEEVILKCSNCNKPLLQVYYKTDCNCEDIYRVRAKCPYCGDYSYEKCFTGKFYAGGIGETVILDQDTDENKTLFIVGRKK